MKQVFLTALVVSLAIIFLSQLKFINRPLQDNDEGIYLTTFRLIDAGYPAYKETFLSQPPGFLLSVYPGFILFGKSLPAARLTIGLWSLIGLLAIVWIGFELGNNWAGLFTISLLYLIPHYFNQTTTFQSDVLIGVFSLLSLALLLRYLNTDKLIWFVAATFFLQLAFWTKFDLSLLPSFLLIIYFNNRKKNPVAKLWQQLLLFFAGVAIFFLIFIYPLGISAIFQNVIKLRLQATASAPSSFWQLFNFLKSDIFLSFVIIGGIIFGLGRKEFRRYPLIILPIWAFSQLILLFLYRPLFSHHLAILAVPMALFFSHALNSWLKKPLKQPYYQALMLIFLCVSIAHYAFLALKSPTGILSSSQKSAIAIIQKNTLATDIVVSDEEILNAGSNRLPPPQLSDISFVRIQSNNLSSESFKQIIAIYKPKLIIDWNGRIRSIKSFNEVIEDYRLLTTLENSKKIYIRAL